LFCDGRVMGGVSATTPLESDVGTKYHLAVF